MIDFSPDDEQQSILDNISGVLSREAPVSRLRDSTAKAGQVANAEFIRRVAGLGWLGLGLSEDKGGAGYGLVEEMLLFQEAGRHLVTPKLLACVLGARAAALGGQVDLAGDILGGTVQVALLSPLGLAEIGPSSRGTFYRLDGEPGDFLLAIDGRGAELIDGAAFAAAEKLRGLDDHVGLAKARLDGATARAWVPFDRDPSCLRATILISATLVGIAAASRDLAVSYAKLREQFGQPIGAFQAVKHHCADMAVRCEAAQSLTTFAMLAVRDHRDDAAFQAAAAKLVAIGAGIGNAEKTIQVHGGMGFTADCEANLYLKRAHLFAELGGNARSQQARLLAETTPA